MRPFTLLLAVSPLVGLLAVAQDPVTPALETLADAERAFAKTATIKGIRDSFLEFFADDAVALVPEPASWKARLRSRPSVPFAEHELLWEPRLGDIAASGELGWLTGPSTFTDRKKNAPPQHGNYLSVWRKQPDGSWKVFLDIGSDSPMPVPFAPGFNRFQFGPRFSGGGDKASATASLLERDRALNARCAAEVPSAAYGPFLSDGVRLHRDGMPAVVGRDAASSWLSANTPSLTAVTGAGESALSGDLGYTYGTYATKEVVRRGSFMRIWTRNAKGEWQIVAEVMSPPVGQ